MQQNPVFFWQNFTSCTALFPSMHWWIYGQDNPGTCFSGQIFLSFLRLLALAQMSGTIFIAWLIVGFQWWVFTHNFFIKRQLPINSNTAALSYAVLLREEEGETTFGMQWSHNSMFLCLSCILLQQTPDCLSVGISVWQHNWCAFHVIFFWFILLLVPGKFKLGW